MKQAAETLLKKNNAELVLLEENLKKNNLELVIEVEKLKKTSPVKSDKNEVIVMMQDQL